jgi:NIPSNAP
VEVDDPPGHALVASLHEPRRLLRRASYVHTLHSLHLDPNRLKHFRDYVEHELEAIRNAGGKVIGYWLPTDYAGPNNVAYGLINFLTLASYEEYRKALADDPLHQRNAAELIRSGAMINMERSIIERCSDGKEQ